MHGESLVLAGTTPGRLIGTHIRPESVVVRSTYERGLPSTMIYQPGRDYTVDLAGGTISRTPGSRIPDFARNMLYGQKDFDHSRFPGYGNLAHTIYVDYETPDPVHFAAPVDARAQLQKTSARLRSGNALKVIAFGDSIAAGGDTSTPELQFGARYAGFLQKQFPAATVTFENGATGGDTTVQGLARLNEKVLQGEPDLVLLAFGMNDHNISGTPIPAFKDNLRSLVQQIRDKTNADVILLSTFPPNPDWHYGTHRMEAYAEATAAVADEMNVAYADVFGVWSKVLQRKDPPSLLANNINHPNDFGHWLYVEALESLQF